MLKYVPIVGWAWNFSDIAYLDRNWEKDQETINQSVKVRFVLKKVYKTQCGNFRIFLSLRFYVKSVLGILEVQNLPL